jgi:hypothetical protein
MMSCDGDRKPGADGKLPRSATRVDAECDMEHTIAAPSDHVWKDLTDPSPAPLLRPRH